ncbi:Kazal-type serine protease inhibitor family protein [Algoriphagus persicinus]|uniref:Kazal-type serine protease inhibitor family protein n=1 Tax=Algoriphagus persicinus TaxID=3108754 RepID=UPI002B3E315B|nr:MULTISPECIES: Kazal-type serine protease inhibitor [unclassified Algoriphagus]MEB2778798.1 Kazal-type serine protease inhibitor [Algoriphagus sp. C2-6-M1]MEB2783313.1 Kazal-type serine protease inhibitor [Algoriphagus sp. E1-3-M2]
MKQAKIILFGIGLVCILGCEEEKPITTCIDESKIIDIACTYIYSPVCGCNGLTYGNSCEAESAGVKSWVEGKCN